MPVRKVRGGWRWGRRGKVYPTRRQAWAQGGRSRPGGGDGSGDRANLVRTQCVYRERPPRCQDEARFLLAAGMQRPARRARLTRVPAGSPCTEGRRNAQVRPVPPTGQAPRLVVRQVPVAQAGRRAWPSRTHPADCSRNGVAARGRGAALDSGTPCSECRNMKRRGRLSDSRR
jgi:hypothetical protein